MADRHFYDVKQNVTLAQVAEVTSAVLTDASKAGEIIADIATMASAGASDICFFYDRKECI